MGLVRNRDRDIIENERGRREGEREREREGRERKGGKGGEKRGGEQRDEGERDLKREMEEVLCLGVVFGLDNFLSLIIGNSNNRTTLGLP